MPHVVQSSRSTRLGPGVTGVSLAVDDTGRLVAQIAFDAPQETAPDITVCLDGEHWATLPCSFLDAGRHALSLHCSLPPSLSANTVPIVLKVADTGALLGEEIVRITNIVTNAHGLAARDVYDPAVAPLFSVPWLQFDGAELIVSGAHLPPGGDPGRLSVSLREGVDAAFEYPLQSPEFGAHYWYWPNAHMSGFRLRVNLPGCARGANPFTFRFETGTPVAAAQNNKRPWQDRARVWIPADLHDYLGLPPGGTQLTRVQTWSEHKTVTFTGYNAFRGLESLLAHHGVRPRAGLRILDWGCGHGRVTRHLIRHWPQADIAGTDIDAENIAWCKAHLTDGTFVTAPLWPPLPFGDAQYDVVFGLSVMTHLTADAQRAWIGEIRRILKPGGLALISFGGDASAMFASLNHDAAWWRRWREAEFDDGLADPHWRGRLPMKAITASRIRPRGRPPPHGRDQ